MDSLRCSLTGQLPYSPVTTYTGNTYEASWLTQYLKETYPSIDVSEHPKRFGIRNNLLHREIIIYNLVKQANESESSHRKICLSFSKLADPSDDYQKINRKYDWIRKIGACDKTYTIPLVCPYSGQPLQFPVLAECGHTFEASAIPKEGIFCPFPDCHAEIYRETVCGNRSIFNYINNLLVNPDIPTDVEGVYLDLNDQTTMADLSFLAKKIARFPLASRVAIFGEEDEIPPETTLEDVYAEVPEGHIPYLFAQKIKGGFDFSYLDK